MKVWLETSAVVLLNFRQQKHADSVRCMIPAGAEPVVSAYVLFELARGYVRRLRELLELSLTCNFPDELREKVEEGEKGKARYTRESDTWTDVLNDDFRRIRQLSAEDQEKWRALDVARFRSRLRTVILDGWDNCRQWDEGSGTEKKPLPLEQGCGCRSDLPPPARNGDLLAHDLPLTACGKPGNCGVLAFSRRNEAGLRGVQKEIGKSKAKAKKGERERRIAGLEHLLGVEGPEFDGTHCHNCGDAMIAAEAGTDAVVTKDRDFLKICKALGAPAPVVVRHC